MNEQDINDLKRDLFIDDSSYASLNEEFKSHSSKHANWIVIAAQLGKEVSSLKMRVKVLEAEIIKNYRVEYQRENSKPLAATFNFKEVLPLNEEWKELQQEVMSKEEEAEIARGAVYAFNERGHLLRLVSQFVEATTLPTPQYKSAVSKLEESTKTLGIDIDEEDF